MWLIGAVLILATFVLILRSRRKKKRPVNNPPGELKITVKETER